MLPLLFSGRSQGQSFPFREPLMGGVRGQGFMFQHAKNTSETAEIMKTQGAISNEDKQHSVKCNSMRLCLPDVLLCYIVRQCIIIINTQQAGKHIKIMTT